jgi:hypothetical protein
MSGCDRSLAYGIPNYPICSGHGVCVDNKCICDNKWTGYSDLELVDGYDCDINHDIVVAWAAIDVCLTAIAMMVIGYYIIQEKMLTKAKWSKVKSLCFFAFFLMNMFGALHAIEKIRDPMHAIIGRSVYVEIWALGITSMALYGLSGFFIIMIKFLKSYSRMLDPITKARLYSTMDKLVTLAPIFPTMFLVAYAAIIFSAQGLPPSYSDSLNIGGYLLYTIAYCYYSATVIYVLHVFLNEVGKYLESTKESTMDNSLTSSQEIFRVYEKVQVAYRFLLPFQVGGAPINIIFAAWHFLRRKLVYLLLFELTTMAVLSAFIARSLTSVRKQNRIDQNDPRFSPPFTPRRYSFELILSPKLARLTPFQSPSITPRIVPVSNTTSNVVMRNDIENGDS